ncbi:hypothetical protein F2P16.4 [Arabidopsis thaliana]|uniref:Uncharacterized protein F2P16.4 n=1 Tax=Arabidopsis thaliana TaxID=3702 RepID=O04628_ARATH|nr:hypothetical protein F2P16.4 [Arabidopsis thaliana]
MAWMRLIQSARSVLTTAPASSTLNFHRFYSKSAAPYHGVETHIAKLETELGDLPKLLVTRTLRLKKFGIPCKHVCSHFLLLTTIYFFHVAVNRFCEQYHVWVCSLNSSYLYFGQSSFENSEFWFCRGN